MSNHTVGVFTNTENDSFTLTLQDKNTGEISPSYLEFDRNSLVSEFDNLKGMLFIWICECFGIDPKDNVEELFKDEPETENQLHELVFNAYKLLIITAIMTDKNQVKSKIILPNG